jgi:hypothetical protein
LAEQERLIALHGIQPGAQEASALAQKSFRLTTEAIFPMVRTIYPSTCTPLISLITLTIICRLVLNAL